MAISRSLFLERELPIGPQRVLTTWQPVSDPRGRKPESTKTGASAFLYLVSEMTFHNFLHS
jgi:hypothetical protein